MYNSITLFNPFIHQWAFRLFPYLGYCESCGNVLGSAAISLRYFLSLDYTPRIGSYGSFIFNFLGTINLAFCYS